jgi:hypothetical protein
MGNLHDYRQVHSERDQFHEFVFFRSFELQEIFLIDFLNHFYRW